MELRPWTLPNLLTFGRLVALPFLIVAILEGRHGSAFAIFLAAAFCWAIYTLMGRRLMSMAEPFRVSAWAMTFGGLFLSAWALPELLTIDWTGLPADFWLEILYLALLPTAIGYALYYRGVHEVGPTTASIMMFLVPISGASMAVLLLGQSLAPLQLLGALTMAGGALLAVLSTGARIRWRSVVAR